MLMPFTPLILAALAAAPVQIDTTVPSTGEIQVQAAMDEAWNARRRVLHALCGEDSRERRLRVADERYQAAFASYRTRFGHGWNAPADMSTRQWECTLPDGFEWTLASYHNTLAAIDAALER